MRHTYIVEGMTCQNCKAAVTEALTKLDGVTNVVVDLESKEVEITMNSHVETALLKSSLPERYILSEKDTSMNLMDHMDNKGEEEKSKFQQLKPLFLILFYISVASILIHKDTLDVSEIMLDFMGLFFIVFSFFKMLDLKGFANTFLMYDPIALKVPIYGRIYPFLETILGVMFLMRFNLQIALIATIVILGFTTYGVLKTLLAKRTIKCACLGTALDLPMTEATFIENAIMIIMSIVMLIL